MTHLQQDWEGASLSGGYTLGQWLGGDEKAAFFQTSPAPGGCRAVVKVIPEAVVTGVSPLDLWHRTRQLRHPNLIELLDCGRAGHRGEIVLYAVFEAPDDTLEAALNRSPLDRDESREVLDSVVDGLRYLHAQGLVHGRLDSDHIVAVGDRIKLSTDDLRDADASRAYREDVRLLGDLWQRYLLSASPKSPEIAAHAADPNPQTRWTLAEISAALSPPAPTAPPPTMPLIVAPPIPVHAPVVPPSRRHRPERAMEYRFPKWIFAGAAGILLLILGLHLLGPVDVATESPVAPVSLPVESRAPAPIPKSAAPEAAAPTAGKASMGGGREMWRVIAFTYRTQEAAARKAQQLNDNHPGLNANVFSPKDKGGYYLISLGGRMTHDVAVSVQRSARGKGLPRDLYVQNYSE